MKSTIRTIAVAFIFAAAFVRSGETNTVPSRLKVGVVQMALGQTITENRDQIVAGLSK